jgi:hypothetical protein|tara:strand:+ start:1629 stop:1868 length:240 start_codon:yes stop_codon:yes gene_type:complete
LIRVIKRTKEQQFILGTYIGVISFNNKMLKEVEENGIITIPTDANLIEARLGQMILNNEHVKIENQEPLNFKKIYLNYV